IIAYIHGKIPEELRPGLQTRELVGASFRVRVHEDGVIDGIESRGLSWEKLEDLRRDVEAHNEEIYRHHPDLRHSVPTGKDLYLGTSRTEAERQEKVAAEMAEKAAAAAAQKAANKDLAWKLSIMQISTPELPKDYQQLDRAAVQ